MRGDRPVAASDSNMWIKFTPHARGSTLSMQVYLEHVNVYPACAGIDRHLRLWKMFLTCLPRMRGDRPFKWKAVSGNYRFTPHARGSTA